MPESNRIASLHSGSHAIPPLQLGEGTHPYGILLFFKAIKKKYKTGLKAARDYYPALPAELPAGPFNREGQGGTRTRDLERERRSNPHLRHPLCTLFLHRHSHTIPPLQLGEGTPSQWHIGVL